ncbi:MAG: deoxyribodipyrimidine photo-lyase [Ramlibacter sp.]
MWFRRDLRLRDNAALHHATTACRAVHCVFVFDDAILAPLPREDRRVAFIRESLAGLDAALRERSGQRAAGVIVLRGDPAKLVPRLARELGAQAVFANKDYEPDAIARDDAVRTALARERIEFHAYKDQVIREEREVLTGGGTPYSVFTPYRRTWLALLEKGPLPRHDADAATFAPRPAEHRKDVPSLEALDFAPFALEMQAGESGAASRLADFERRIEAYDESRDYPAVKGPSFLSVDLRFGTVSIRELVSLARARALRAGVEAGNGAATWLSELAWRDFYFQILANFPHVVNGAFKPRYDAIAWAEGAQADAHFDAWCAGRTGFALVDAGMRQLNATGYMHNRLRMVTASFLTKDLGIDWRRGERYFAEKLLDYDLAANNGGWQWAASTGCDAQPWFRIFNPESQLKKFDPRREFVDRWVPPGEPRIAPIVDHEEARRLTLTRFGAIRDKD